MIKKFYIALSLLFITGCTNEFVDTSTPNEEVTPSEPFEEDIPNVENDLTEDEDLEDQEVYYNEYHDLLLSYVFINVTSSTKIDLPSSIMGEKIIWRNNNNIITSILGTNNKYYLTASIGNLSRNFNISFVNGKVDEISQQDIIFKYIFISDSRKLGTYMNPSQIIFHNTANSAPALNEVMYLNSIYNTSSVSFHYAVDDIGVYQAVPTNIYAHHAGNLSVNKQSIGVEIAKSLSTNVSEKNKAIYNAQKLIRLLQMKYNISNVSPHYDITGKHCPHDIFDRYSIDLFYSELNSLHNTIL